MIMIKTLLLATLYFCLALNMLYAQSVQNGGEAEKSPRYAIHLLDYLAHDYQGAVSDGKILSQSEFNEQKEFSEKIIEISSTVPEIKNDPLIFSKVQSLKTLINNKASAIDVALLARDLQKVFINISKIELAPNAWPSLANGKILFEQNCTSCHGKSGMGDGPSAKDLTPKPANFFNSTRMNSISAFHSYNTIRLGVPGTSMVAWNQFSDKEVWDLAFYVMSLRHVSIARKGSISPTNTYSFTLEDMASLSDAQLMEKIYTKENKNKELALAMLRTKNNTTTNSYYLNKAKNFLDQSLEAYKNNSTKDSKRLALQAYLEGIEPVEPAIKANDSALVSKIEIEMSKIRKIISDNTNSPEILESQILTTQKLLNEVEEALTKKELSFGVAFSGAFGIILREGFEAVLIILTLLSVIKAFGNKRAAMWVHAGWLSALALGFVAWTLSGFLMKLSGASREMLEAVTSTFAVIVLLYFGFWLHRQTEITRWKKFIHEKVKGAIDNKNLWALASISFLSVFREAFETVLFIRALYFQTNEIGKNAIGLGLATALILIFVLSYFALAYSKKMPIRELFKISSILTSLLAFILSGKAVHSLQEAGILNSTSLPINLRFDTFGLFPTWQTMTAQMFTLLLAFILLNLNTRSNSSAQA